MLLGLHLVLYLEEEKTFRKQKYEQYLYMEVKCEQVKQGKIFKRSARFW